MSTLPGPIEGGQRGRGCPGRPPEPEPLDPAGLGWRGPVAFLAQLGAPAGWVSRAHTGGA